MSEENGNIITLGCVTRLDLPPDRILEAAKGSLKGVVVIGWNNEDEFYAASSIADGGDVLWLLRKTEQMLMEVSE